MSGQYQRLVNPVEAVSTSERTPLLAAAMEGFNKLPPPDPSSGTGGAATAGTASVVEPQLTGVVDLAR
jgi:hypothetical protein